MSADVQTGFHPNFSSFRRGNSLARHSSASPLIIGIIISILLHLALIPTLLWFDRAPAKLTGVPVVEVSFVANEERKQIVSASEATLPVTPPEQISRVAERDSFVEREQIKRGLPDAGPVVSERSQAIPPPPARSASKSIAPAKAEQSAQKIAEKKAEAKTQQLSKPRDRSEPEPSERKLETADLRLNRAALMDAFGESSRSGAQNGRSVSNEQAPSPQPFSRAIGSGAAFYGSLGSPDYLPSLPDGDMTMLNAKASKYATFVRRVAIQVFTALRSQGWDSLSGREINSASTSTFARAVLNPRGELIKVEIVERSGSNSFDRVVLSSIKTGARDPNPPADARADDGNYRFVFEARSWARMAANPRNGNPMERRWLMLGTGLE